MHRLAGFLILASIFTAACGFGGSQPESTAQTNSTDEAIANESYRQPFQSKEPEKYQAKIVFAFKWDESNAESIEQTTFVARDGLNRRLDFEIGDKRQISRLETADGKRFLLVPQRKIYAEISEGASENLIGAAPEEYSLAHLFYAKPPEAKFQKIGAETINGKQLTKYLVDFGAVRQSENAKTETAVWVDENLGLPVRTEISAIVDQKPSGAKSLAELRDFKSDPDAIVFIVPADYRRVSVKELQEVVKPK
jgi:outer membrane lipoprotein-sorting protein